MKAFRFLLTAFVWLLFLGSLMLAMFLDSSQEFVQGCYAAYEAVREGFFLFQGADHWNFIALTFFAAASVIVLALNDSFIRRLFTPGRLSFWSGGVLWLARLIVNAGLFVLEVIILCYVVSSTYSTPPIVPASDIKSGRYLVLLLGTSKYLRGTRNVNFYYAKRVEACFELYKNGVIRELIISGDSSSAVYDKAEDMHKDLERLGMRGVVVRRDTGGKRTFDSIKRMLPAAGRGNQVLIVSQSFHLQRALYLAKMENIEARGVLAEGSLNLKMFERELFAKTRVLLDIYIFNTQAKGIYSRPRRLIDVSSLGDLCLLGFVLLSLAIAGRMMRGLVDY